jgi:hypothetical protein
MSTLGRLLVVVSLVTCVACQGGSSDDADGPDAQPGAADASTGSLQLTCNADNSTTFPAFSRSCQDATECAIANHQIDCCGSTIATGIAATDLAAFEQSESACATLFPACGCASQPPVLDDGTMASNLGTIDVGCSNEGTCVTFNAEQPGGGL